MRVGLVANPASGRGVDPEDLVRQLRELGCDVEMAALDEAPPAGVERLVVAGGDGSIGPCAAAAGAAGIPLAVVPLGTANDFARHHGLPLDPEEALRLAAIGREVSAQELARMDGRPFVNVASGGLAPLAAGRARPLKRVLGPVAYAVGALSAGLTGDPFRCRARVDGDVVFEEEAWQVIVASTGAFGAGAEVSEADPGDGRLDLVAVPARSRMELPSRAAAMRRGDLATQEGVLHRRGDEIVLEVAEATPFNVDGEIVICETGTVRFSVEQDAYDLVLPAPARSPAPPRPGHGA